MSSIYLSDQLKSKLVRAAGRRGYVVERGRQSQLAEYLAYLIRLNEQTGRPERWIRRSGSWRCLVKTRLPMKWLEVCLRNAGCGNSQAGSLGIAMRVLLDTYVVLDALI